MCFNFTFLVGLFAIDEDVLAESSFFDLAVRVAKLTLSVSVSSLVLAQIVGAVGGVIVCVSVKHTIAVMLTFNQISRRWVDLDTQALYSLGLRVDLSASNIAVFTLVSPLTRCFELLNIWVKRRLDFPLMPRSSSNLFPTLETFVTSQFWVLFLHKLKKLGIIFNHSLTQVRHRRPFIRS